jgi:glutathione S-transferase
VKLYTDPFGPNPRRVHWLMAEKGIGDIEVVPVSLVDQAHKTAEYLDMAGVPQVPQLVLDDGTVIGESLAICRYLESLHPEPNLFGRDALETALIETWTRRAEMMFATPLMLAVRFAHPALACLEPGQSPERAAAQKALAERALPLLERRLDGREWLAADRLTIADIVAGSSLSFARMIRFEIDEAYPNLRRWAEAALARPGARPKRS